MLRTIVINISWHTAQLLTSSGHRAVFIAAIWFRKKTENQELATSMGAIQLTQSVKSTKWKLP